MADRKEGTFVGMDRTKNKGFAFARIDGEKREVFVHIKDLPGLKDMNDGDRISFEESAPDPAKKDQTKALNIQVLSPTPSPAPSPVPVPAPGPPTPAPPAAQPRSIEVDWSPGTPTRNVLPITLTLQGAKGKSGIEIKLKANGIEMNDPLPNPSPDGQGKVIFLVPLAGKTKMYAFAGEILVDGKVVKTSSYLWEKRPGKKIAPPPVAPPPATADELKLPEIEVINKPRDPDSTTGMFLVNVVTRKDGKKANRDFTAHSDRTVEIQQSHPAGMIVVTTFTADTIGHYPLYVNFDGIMAKIVFKLDNGKEAAAWLRK